MRNFLLSALAAVSLSLSPVALAKCDDCKDHQGDHASCKDHHGKHAKDGKKGHKHAKGKKGCCDDKEKKQGDEAKAAPERDKRVPASATKIRGDVAKLIYEGLPGAPDRLAKAVVGKEGDLICYKREEAYHCSVRGEDEESGRFEGAPAKSVFDQLSSDQEYEDGPGLAREASAKCTLKNGTAYVCMIGE